MTRYVIDLETQRISRDHSRKLELFQELFLKWNQSINLSGAKTGAEVDEHIRDSLHVVPYLPPAGRVLDVGSGGGFPVVVTAICLPDAQFTALEPVHKKHAFLRTAARELELLNLEAFAKRVEDYEDRDFDAVTSRATFDLADWLTLGLTLVRPGGLVIGFEAIQRDDLPESVQRFTYELGGKQRSIVTVHRPA
ncbi:MAG: methyltransferase GidB [Deltaproteobacteria bacterium]|nr:methyltransferase GidB [Deltaproteobacteria bacterium]